MRDRLKQSIGRTGTHYSYNKVGNVALRDEGERGTVIVFSGLDFRPSNGPGSADLLSWSSSGA